MSHTRNTNDYLNAENTERFKRQATSGKLHKGVKLDKGPGLGYTRIITNGKARHAQLNASPSIPPGSKPIKDLMKAVASPGVGIKTSSAKLGKIQATSGKPQA